MIRWEPEVDAPAEEGASVVEYLLGLIGAYAEAEARGKENTK